MDKAYSELSNRIIYNAEKYNAISIIRALE